MESHFHRAGNRNFADIESVAELMDAPSRREEGTKGPLLCTFRSGIEIFLAKPRGITTVNLVDDLRDDCPSIGGYFKKL